MSEAFLKFLSNPKKGEAVSLTANKNFVIGRLNSCDLMIDEGSVSREHAEISLSNGTWVIRDTSKSGTRVNGKKITEHKLQEGDVVTIGKKDMKFTSDPNKPDQPPPSAAPAPSKKKHVERFKPAAASSENSGGTAFVDMASMFGSEGGSAGTMNVDMDEFLGEDPEAGKKALIKVGIISGSALFLIIIIGVILYIRKPTITTLTEAALSVGEKRDLSVVPYGNLKFDDVKISVTETTIEDVPTLSIVGLEVGEAQIEITDYQGNFIIYTIPVEERQLDLIALDIQARFSGKSESEKLKLSKDWLSSGDHRMKVADVEPSSHYEAFEFYYRAELILETLANPPGTYKEARDKRKEQVETLDRIFKIRRREFQNALNVKDKKKGTEIIAYLKLVFPNEKYFHPDTKENYRRLLIWMENRLNTLR